jgi:uncharacterized delta-60 repeat protein
MSNRKPRRQSPFGRWACILLGIALLQPLFLNDKHIIVQSMSGDLDLTFGTGGKVTTDFSKKSEAAVAVLVQPDGKIVAGGSSGPFGVDFALARYNPDGTLDTSFGSGGRVTTNLGGACFLLALALQADGKIVAAGGVSSSDPFNIFTVARYRTDGTLDPAFGISGRAASINVFGENYVLGLAIQRDRKIVAGGDFILARYNAEGTLDTSFGAGGIVLPGAYNQVVAVGLQSDQKIIIGVSKVNFAKNEEDFVVARFRSNGVLDTSFGTGGFSDFTPFQSPVHLTSIVVQPDDAIIAGGLLFGGLVRTFALVRYTPNGKLDTSFGTNGTVTTSFIGSSQLAALALQRDGKIIAAGKTTKTNDPFSFDFALVRYSSDGSLDSGFGNGGRIRTTFSNDDDVANAVAVQPDGKIVAAGSTFSIQTENDFALARYNNSESFDVCLQDTTSGDWLKFSSTTGYYVFEGCGSSPFSLSGKGSVRTVNGVVFLTDNKPDRKLSAGLVSGQLTGRATIMIAPAQGIYQTYVINSTNVHPTCVCQPNQ